MNKRQEEILNYINQKAEVSIHELISEFEKSEQTIRNDLRTLSENGKITRTYGGALSKYPSSESSYSNRKNENISVKRSVGKKASEFIENGDIIYMDAGTSVLSIIEFLPQDININVFTCGIHIADALCKFENVEVHVIGGLLNKNLKELYGPKAISEIKKLKFDKMFLSVSSFNTDAGLFENHIFSSEIKKEVIQVTSKIYAICDATKENKIGIDKVANWNQINTVIIDEHVSEEAIKSFQYHNIEYHIAK